jgi:hypothetical protein
LGLGLSGHPKAAEILRSLQQPEAARELGIDPDLQMEMADMISELLEANQFIAREGLLAYYDEALADDDDHEDNNGDDDDRSEETTSEDK